MDLGLLHSFIGKRFKQPLVLIQSDDWGLNRNGTAAALQALAGRYPEAVKTPMQRYDILESEEDVGLLRQVLEDTAAVMTCNAVMANVDFEETLHVGKFVQEGVVETYRRIYGEGLGGYEGLKAGQEAGVFDMQFHGGVHLQYRRWMEAVAQGDLTDAQLEMLSKIATQINSGNNIDIKQAKYRDWETDRKSVV